MENLTVKKGSENMPLTMKEWQRMKITVQGTKLTGYLNGKILLEHTLTEPASGRVGVSSKTDLLRQLHGHGSAT